MVRRIDITGQRFGRLQVLKYAHTYGSQAYWACICDCGNEVVTRGTGLRYGSSKSCGCLQRDRTSERCTHGLSGTRDECPRLYRAWQNMKQRCGNPNAAKYELYGGRGIKVCDEWHDDYIAFHEWAMANGYRDDLTLDRINGDGNYEPSNCRWASYKQQARNTSARRVLKFQGKSLSVTEWAERLGMSPSVLSSRINTYCWSIEKALTTPVQHRRSAS